ncbi:MAG: segregation/condensation protein A [Candidatus Nanohaloarchaea archaeon]
MQQEQLENLTQRNWEEVLDFLTSDMDPENVDIIELAERYREYIDELKELDLQVSGRAIRICSTLLKMKTLALAGEETEQHQEEEDPMAFEEETIEEDEEPDLEVGPELEMPVKAKPKRRMSLNELKDALRDAMEVKERREERQQHRQEMDQHFEMEEETLEDKINSLFTRLNSLVNGKTDQVNFEKLLERNDNEERIEKFLHVLHLETDEKVKCRQEEFLGDLKVIPQEQPEQVAN